MSAVTMNEFEIAGFGQREKNGDQKRKPQNNRGRASKISSYSTDVVDLFSLGPEYTSAESVLPTEEGAVMQIKEAQEKLMDGGTVIFVIAAVVFLVLLFSERVPKNVSIIGFLMSASTAGYLAWERHARRQRG